MRLAAMGPWIMSSFGTSAHSPSAVNFFEKREVQGP